MGGEPEAVITEARQVARVAVSRETDSGPELERATGADLILASLGARAGVDRISPGGRMPQLKQLVLRASGVFLRDQAAFNRLVVSALEELGARIDEIEARLTALEPAEETEGATH